MPFVEGIPVFSSVFIEWDRTLIIRAPAVPGDVIEIAGVSILVVVCAFLMEKKAADSIGLIKACPVYGSV